MEIPSERVKVFSLRQLTVRVGSAAPRVQAWDNPHNPNGSNLARCLS